MLGRGYFEVVTVWALAWRKARLGGKQGEEINQTSLKPGEPRYTLQKARWVEHVLNKRQEAQRVLYPSTPFSPGQLGLCSPAALEFLILLPQLPEC